LDGQALREGEPNKKGAGGTSIITTGVACPGTGDRHFGWEAGTLKGTKRKKKKAQVARVWPKGGKGRRGSWGGVGSGLQDGKGGIEKFCFKRNQESWGPGGGTKIVQAITKGVRVKEAKVYSTLTRPAPTGRQYRWEPSL